MKPPEKVVDNSFSDLLSDHRASLMRKATARRFNGCARLCPNAGSPLAGLTSYMWDAHAICLLQAALDCQTRNDYINTMDETQARKILGDAVQKDDSLGGEGPYRFGIYKQWTGGNTITLGDVDDLTADELEAIAWWIRNKTVKD